MKRINPLTNQFFKRGDIRKQDNRVFAGYLSRKRKDGYFIENWLTPDAMERRILQHRKTIAKHYRENAESYIRRAKEHAIRNPEAKKQAKKKYKRANPDKIKALRAKRRAAKLLRTPKWLTKDHLLEIEDFYVIAKMFQMYTGEMYHVDHILPLQGENVSGLHVPWNLQVLPWHENVKKSNKHPE